MTKLRLAAGLVLACVCCGVVGCVPPGEIDNTVLNRYSAALAARGAQQRLGGRGLGLLQPVGAVGPMLKVVGDANGQAVAIHLSLKEAVLRAVANSLDVRVVSFDPEMSREEMVKAAAAFDAVVFAGYDYSRADALASSVFAGTQRDTQVWSAGVRQFTPSGGAWSITYAMTRLWDNSAFSAMPITYEPTLVLEVSQPLLRDAWPEFNLANLRIARTNRKVSEAQFRAKLEETVANVISGYWALWEARQEAPIRRKLLAETRKTLQKVRARQEIDAGAAQIRQAEAAVKQRELLLDFAIKAAQDAQDNLLRLLADPQLNLVSGYQVVPVSPPAQSPLELDLTDQLLAALEHSPTMEQARLAVALADINVKVAVNQTLPRLDLTGSVGYQGLGPKVHEAGEKFWTLDYLSYGIGVSFEYPLGNRERRAELRRTRLSRLQAVAQMQNTADQIALAVKERVREIGRAFRETELQRAVVKAKTLELQAIEDIERIRGRLTPEFLNLKLSTQGQLADAEIAELAAIQNYNLAVAQLAQVTGTILKQYSVQVVLSAAVGAAAWPYAPAQPATKPVGPGAGRGR
ncbi:MAG TPA: TolC family protein [Phycisphaerae bacterium]|nr:TolC family protein [Phycisphaerae bacterium]